MLPVIVFHSVRRHSIRCIRDEGGNPRIRYGIPVPWLLLKVVAMQLSSESFQVNGRLIQHHTGVRMPCQLIQHELLAALHSKEQARVPSTWASVYFKSCMYRAMSFPFCTPYIASRCGPPRRHPVFQLECYADFRIRGVREETCMSLLLPECPDAGPDG